MSDKEQEIRAAEMKGRGATCGWEPQADTWGEDYADQGWLTSCGKWYIEHQIEAGPYCPNCGRQIERIEIET